MKMSQNPGNTIKFNYISEIHLFFNIFNANFVKQKTGESPTRRAKTQVIGGSGGGFAKNIFSKNQRLNGLSFKMKH